MYMRRRLFMVAIWTMMALSTALAQSFVVKGVIVSKEDGEPLIGVSIRQLENPNNGAITDFDGNYSIEVEGKEATLSFTYLGMKEEHRKVTAKTQILRCSLMRS